MSSLYKRATPAQAKVLRIIEGAVKNAAHAHPEFEVTDRFARSIAKRAAGTLTAQWPEVLAARFVPSDMQTAGKQGPRRSAAHRASGQKGRRAIATSRLPGSLVRIWKQFSFLAGQAKRDGDEVRRQACVDALRAIASLQQKK